MRSALTVYTFTIACVVGLSTATAQEFFERASDRTTSPDGGPDLEQAEKQIIARTNRFRQEHDLEPVERNSELDAAAEYFAQFMARTDKYGHRADGSTPSERAEEHGYDYCIVAENIAMQYSSAGFGTKELARKFVRGWIESPKHRENMLNPNVTEIGVAIAQSDDSGRYYAVQMFGRPRSAQIEFQIANESQTTVRYELGDRTFRLPPRYTRTHQRCRPSKLIFRRPEAESVTFTPEDGDSFVVTASQDAGYEVARQSPEE